MKKPYCTPELEISFVAVQRMIALSVEKSEETIDDASEILSKRYTVGETSPSFYWREEAVDE